MLKLHLFFLSIGCLAAYPAVAQTFTTLATLPLEIPEASGLEITGPNELWTFNDSGGEAILYGCDTMGNLFRTIELTNAWNRDWEDITQDNQGNLYVGNFGNNDNDETDLSIFKIPPPGSIAGDMVMAEVITFAYEDQTAFPPPDDSQHFDCEALCWFQGQLYLFTKDRSDPFAGETHLYRLPDTPGTYTAERIGTFVHGGDIAQLNWITAADLSPDGSKLALLSTDKLWLFHDFSGDDFFGGQYLRIDLPFVSQKEAVCFASETRLLITDELVGGLLGGKLYALDISGLLTPDRALAPEEGLQVFPNPTRGRIQVSGLPAGPLEVIIRDGYGRELHRLTKVTGNELDLSSWSAGTYFVAWQKGARRWHTTVMKY